MGFWDGVANFLDTVQQGARMLQVDATIKPTVSSYQERGFDIHEVINDGFSVLLRREKETGFINQLFGADPVQEEFVAVYLSVDAEVKVVDPHDFDEDDQIPAQRCPSCDDIIENRGPGRYSCETCETQFMRDANGVQDEIEEEEYVEESATISLEDAFKFFDVNPADPEAKGSVKSKYREMMKQYHPDKIQGMNLAEGFKDFATVQTGKIQDHYDVITQFYGEFK